MQLPSEADLLQKLSLEEASWMLGRVLGFSAIENSQGHNRLQVASCFNEALILAARLKVTVPPLPTLTQDKTQDEGAAIRYLLRQAGGAIADALLAQHGVACKALFEASLKLQILYLIYQPKEEMTLALRAAIERSCKEANLPEWLWALFSLRMQDGLPRAEARQEIQRTERLIWIHLNATEAPTPKEEITPPPALPAVIVSAPAPKKDTTPKPSGPVSSSATTPSRPTQREEESVPEPRLLAWMLGYYVATAALGHAQGVEVQSVFADARRFASLIGVELPPLPSRDPDAAKSHADALFYVLKTAGMPIGESLNARYGLLYGALFEASLKSVLMTLFYLPGEEITKTLTGAIRRALRDGGLPARIGEGFLRLVEEGVPYAEMRSALQEMLSMAREHLSTKSRALMRSNQKSTTLRFNKYKSGIVVQVRLAERVTVPLLYDTGATFTCIDEGTAEQLGLRSQQILRYAECSTANGVVTCPSYEISSAEVGDARVEGAFEILVLRGIKDSAASGLLGLNFSRAFIAEIDLEQGALTFKLR